MLERRKREVKGEDEAGREGRRKGWGEMVRFERSLPSFLLFLNPSNSSTQLGLIISSE